MKSFLRELGALEQRIIYDGNSYKPSTKKTLLRLIRYVEGATYTTSLHTKFIARNWRYGSKELLERWNNNEGIDSKKSEVAFRSQISTLSNQLYQMFGSDFFEIFINEDALGITMIDDLLDALDGFPDNIHDYIHSDIVDEGEEVSWSKSYDITELKPTIDMIRPYLRSNINDVLLQIDLEKLGYIINAINNPIMNNTTRKINTVKIDILREFAKKPDIQKSTTINPVSVFLDMIETKINQGLGSEYEDSEENRKLLRKVIKWMSTKQFDKIVNYYHISASDMKSELIKARDAIHDSDR